MKKFVFLNFLLAVLFCPQLFAQQNVGIGTNTPDNSALLDLTSVNKGLLIPRMTTAQRTAITAPATGLLVYDSNLQQFWYFNGTQWTVVAGGGGGSCYTLQQSYDCGGPGAGRNIVISGTNSVNITNANSSSIGLRSSHSADGVSIKADNTYANVQYAAIQASTASNFGTVGGTPVPTTAIIGNSTGKAYGVSGQVEATATGQAGIFGNNLRTTGGHGVYGIGYNGTVGETNYTAGYGVSGWNRSTVQPGVGTFGQGVTGVAGQSTNTALSYGLYSYDDAGIVNILDVGGNLNVVGAKSFLIDNPLDPENKLLKHFCIESPEVLNLYRGNAILNNQGEAVVDLPEYFAAVNKNFSYALTPVGNACPNLFIKEKINNNKFVIAGGQPGSEVSWTVYAERNDQYVKDHPELLETQPVKSGRYSGKYMYPEGYGQSKEKGYLYRPEPSLIGGNIGDKLEQKPIKLFNE